jgi:hypothetical protein
VPTWTTLGTRERGVEVCLRHQALVPARVGQLRAVGDHDIVALEITGVIVGNVVAGGPEQSLRGHVGRALGRDRGRFELDQPAYAAGVVRDEARDLTRALAARDAERFGPIGPATTAGTARHLVDADVAH